MRFLKSFLPAICLPRFLTVPDSFNYPIQFRTGLNFTPESFTAIIKRKSETGSKMMHPFYKTLLKSIADEKEEVEQFSKFLIKDFDHSLLDFDPKRLSTWIDLLNTSFLSFLLVNREEADRILETEVMPAYPILDDNFSVSFIVDEISDGLKLSDLIDKKVVRVFHSKIEILLSATDEQVEEFESFFRVTLWNGRRSIKVTDKRFRYHYAFLANLPLEDLRFVVLPEVDEFDHLQEYLISFSKSAYGQLIEQSPEIVKIALGKVLPNIFDGISFEKTFDQIIEEFVEQDKLPVDTESFIEHVKYMMRSRGTRNGFENFSDKQMGFFELLISEGKDSSLVKFAAKNFPYPPQLSVNEQVAYWEALIFCLIIRFSALYPEEAVELKLISLDKTFTSDYFGDVEFTLKDTEIFAKFGFIEALEMFLYDTKETKMSGLLSDNMKSLFAETKSNNQTFDVMAIDMATNDYFLDPIYEMAYPKNDEIVYEHKEDGSFQGPEESQVSESITFTSTLDTHSCNSDDEKLITTAVSYAAHFGRITMIRIMMKDARFSSDSACGPAVWFAVNQEHFEIARILLDNCKEISPGNVGRILEETVKRGNFEIFQYIFERGLFYDPRCAQNIANIAAIKGDLDVLKFFYDERPEMIADIPRFESVAMAYEWAVVSDQSAAKDYLHQQLLEFGNYNYSRAFVKSAQYGNLEAVRNFLDRYNVKKEKILKMAIDAAAKGDHYEIIQTILDKRPEYRGGLVDALDEAALNGHSDTVEYLLKTFPLLMERDVVRAFYSAVDSRNVNTVQHFIRLRKDDLDENKIRVAYTRASKAFDTPMRKLLYNYFMEY